MGHCQPRASPLLGFEDSAPTYTAELLAYCRRQICAGLDSHSHWVLVEAFQARTEKNRRVLDELDVVATFADSPGALKCYATMHHATPNRELYVFHTSRDHLNIEERQWLGVRAAARSALLARLNKQKAGGKRVWTRAELYDLKN